MRGILLLADVHQLFFELLVLFSKCLVFFIKIMFTFFWSDVRLDICSNSSTSKSCHGGPPHIIARTPIVDWGLRHSARCRLQYFCWRWYYHTRPCHGSAFGNGFKGRSRRWVLSFPNIVLHSFWRPLSGLVLTWALGSGIFLLLVVESRRWCL